MRSAAATVVGWLIVVIFIWITVGWVFALLRWAIRLVAILAFLGILASVYLRLTDDEPGD